jgi:hypothetical protein
MKDHVERYDSLSLTKSEMKTVLERQHFDALARAMFLLEVSASERLVDWIKCQEKEMNLDVRKLLRLRGIQSKTTELELVQFIERQIRLDSKLVHLTFDTLMARTGEAEKERAEEERAEEERAEEVDEETTDDSG